MSDANSTQPSLMGPPLAKAPARQKVALKPGRGLASWYALVQSGADLAGTGGELRRVTAEEVRLFTNGFSSRYLQNKNMLAG